MTELGERIYQYEWYLGSMLQSCLRRLYRWIKKGFHSYANNYGTNHAYYNRGIVYKVLGKKAEAIADFETCIKVSQNPSLIEEARREIEELQAQH